MSDTAQTDIIKQAIVRFRELDKFHDHDTPRLDMNEWGTGPIDAYTDIFSRRDTHQEQIGALCSFYDMDGYDPARNVIVDWFFEREIDGNSDEAQNMLDEYAMYSGREAADDLFKSLSHEFIYDDDPDTACGTAGCAAYWINVWFADEDSLYDMSKSEDLIESSARELLGLSPKDAGELMVPKEVAVYEHARPGNVADVLQRYLDTGVMAWEGIVKCEDDCDQCLDAEGVEAVRE